MSTQLAPPQRSQASEIAERVLLAGDLSKLTAAERVAYYRETCSSLGLNPLTQPFAYITLNGKLTLYARRDCTDQLRALHRVSITIVARELLGDVYVVTAHASTPDGRAEESIGAVAVAGLKGDARANAYMKAETKAKGRVTLSLVGLGWLDESESTSIPNARPANVSIETGEVIDAPQPMQQQPQPAQPQPAQVPAEGGTYDADRQILAQRWEKMRAAAGEWEIPVSPFPEEMPTKQLREVYKNTALATAAEIERVKGLRAQEVADPGDAEPHREMDAVAAADDEPDPFENQ